MNVKSIRENTVMQIVDETTDTAYRALFSELHADKSFYVRAKELYDDARERQASMQLRVGFFSGNSLCSFSGVVEKVRVRGGVYLTLIRQTSPIIETVQRKTRREEMAVPVTLYRLSEDGFQNNKLNRDLDKMELRSISFDISAGGLCLVCNDQLRPSADPFYLVEFMIGKDVFLLPARMVRQGNAPQMVNYRHDYGFQFLYDRMPNEEKRLSNALISAKIAAVMG